MDDWYLFIRNTAVQFFKAEYVHDEEELKSFVENDEIVAISAFQVNDELRLDHRKLPEGPCLIFYKTSHVDKSTDSSLGVFSLKSSLDESVRDSVARTFFNPEGYGGTRKLESVIEKFSSIMSLEMSPLGKGVNSIEDEIKFWNEKTAFSHAAFDQNQVEAFTAILEKIRAAISNIKNRSDASMEELLDVCHAYLDDIWRLPYHFPQNRMADLIDAMCNQIIQASIQNSLQEDLWDLNSDHMQNTVAQMHDFIESWINLCDSLTRLMWPNYSVHPWNGEPHRPLKAQKLKERISEIKNLTKLFKQVFRLLGNQGCRNTLSLTTFFRAVNIFDVSPAGQRQWTKTVNQFELMLQPIEERMCSVIKSQLHQHIKNPRQIIFILSKYDTLLWRPTFKELLSSEEELILQSLKIVTKNLKRSLSDINMESDDTNVSSICTECKWLRVIQAQLQDVQGVSNLFETRDEFAATRFTIKELSNEVENLIKQYFETWRDQSVLWTKNLVLSLFEGQPVVEFKRDAEQYMFVNFDPKLVTFCQEVKEFESYGFRIPTELLMLAQKATKFTSLARSLHQIATFHNTIVSRIIPCQRPIMLKAAVELSKLVHSESVYWNDEKAVKNYIINLQKTVNKLSNDNTKLIGYHEHIKQKVVKLMNADLITQSQIWKDEVHHLRETFSTLDRAGYTNLSAFKLHWDHQLYKVLESQYILGLSNFKNKLPPIYVDILFQEGQLSFRPSEEEIRRKYFDQLQKLVAQPLNFRGFSDKNGDIFKIMVARNKQHLGGLYSKAENTLNSIDKLKSLWLPWVSLGCIDVEEMCRIHLTRSEHWDANFKTCKKISQQVAKISMSEEQFDCFIINILPLKSSIENIIRFYWDTLATTLRNSIVSDISNIQEFTNSSMQFLQDFTSEKLEITSSGPRYQQIATEYAKLSKTLKEVQKKNTCLAGWCKERISALTSLLSQWDKLRSLIEDHSIIMERQLEIAKENIVREISNTEKNIENFVIRWESTITDLASSTDFNSTSLALLKERVLQWESLKQKTEKLRQDAAKFEVEFSDSLADCFANAEQRVCEGSKQWETCENFFTEMDDVIGEYWAVYCRRPYILSEFVTKWEKISGGNSSPSLVKINDKVGKLRSILPILQNLQTDALIEKHWASIFAILEISPVKVPEIRIQDILAKPETLEKNAAKIQAVLRQASLEQVVRQVLNELEIWSSSCTIKLVLHTDSSGNSISLVKDLQEILNKVRENQSLLQSAKNSASFDIFAEQTEIWEKKLKLLDNTLSCLNQCQRKWIYLEPVFCGGALKSDEIVFKRIDKDFRYLIKEIENDPKVMAVLKINNIQTVMSSLENQLAQCQRNLISFLTNKRNSFPRFYFLGNDDLLELLGQSTKAEIIQKHIKKIFPGVAALHFDNNSSTISKIVSSSTDTVNLLNPVEVNSNIEDWLQKFQASVQETLKRQIQTCSKTSEWTKDTISAFPEQVLCTSRAICFTRQCERAISSMSLSSLLISLNEEVQKYTTLKTQVSNQVVVMKIKAFLLDLVHYIEVVDYLIQKNVTNNADWHWLEQMRFYSAAESQIVIKMGLGEFQYACEFLGNATKLVNTKLTHKCYLTLTQSIALGYGGNLFGPAGTGKTECVKSLGSKLGRLVLVFNCDENLTVDALKLIITGIAKCGAWGCFDEFNRLHETTLSTVSSLIKPIQLGLKNKSKSVKIFDDNVDLNLHCGIFVTLNPSDEDYGGRQNLPRNIQALFRPIVMEHPNPYEIADVLLFIEGFQRHKLMAERIVELFKLAPKVLSKQIYYDWGLRELKTVLLACGKLLSENHLGHDDMSIALGALRSNMISKITAADLSRFELLLRNIFTECKEDLSNTSKFREILNDSFASLGLKTNSKQVEKCVQLHDQLTRRMGVILVGPPSSGKSTVISVLKHALTVTGKTIRSYTIGPKAMSRVQLLGTLDPDTKQWIDGVLTSTAYAASSEPESVTSWIICDGEVDPEWIEALNSVFDDNRLLTLPSGWRILFGANVNFIFETTDLTHASPATISRMGIVNLSSDDLDGSILLDAFLKRMDDHGLLDTCMEKYLLPAVNWIDQEFSDYFGISKCCKILHILCLLKKTKTKEEFCVIIKRAICGYLPTQVHSKFAQKLYELADIYLPEPSRAEQTYYSAIRNDVRLYEFDPNSNHSSGSGSALVLTAQIQVCLDTIRDYLRADNAPFIIFGPAGSAKTMTLQSVVMEFPGYRLITVNCSSQISPAYILNVLKQNCVTISGIHGREYRPQQQRTILYLKNIDTCRIDTWGTCSVVELLFQLIQRNGFYAENLEWIGVVGLQICASMDDSSKDSLSLRYLSLNGFVRFKHPLNNEIICIVRNQLQYVTSRFKGSIHKDKLAVDLIQFFDKICQTFVSTNRPYYNFNPKMLTNVLENLTFYPENYFDEAMLDELKFAFRSRLCSKEDVSEFDNILEEHLMYMKRNTKSQMLFVPQASSTLLEAVTSENWLAAVEKHRNICNSESLIISMPPTMEFVQLVANIAKQIGRPEAHLTLIGYPGFNHTEAVYVAMSMLGAKIFIPQGIQGYKVADFYNDLKKAVQSAALDNQRSIFLVDHYWLSLMPDVLKPIEAILQGSEVSDLFGDDLESLANSLKDDALVDGYQGSLSSYFLQRARRNLHLLLNLACTSDNLNHVFDTCPAIYRNSQVIWTLEPSDEELTTLPELILQSLSIEKTEVSIPSYVMDVIQNIDEKCSRKRYHNFIRCYFGIYREQSQELERQLKKLSSGITKLSSTHKEVHELKIKATQQEGALGEKRKLANEALEMITLTMRNANNKKSELLELKMRTQETSEKLKERQKTIELELEKVEPLLNEASAAVSEIKMEALSEIRSLRAPPEIVRDVLEGVLRLMGVRDTSWNSMKTFLAKRGVKEDIRLLDPSKINVENRHAVERLLRAKPESFDPRNAKRASAAAAPLASWVMACVQYSRVVEGIKPLEMEKSELQKDIESSEQQVKSLMTGLDDVDTRVKELSEQLNVYTQEALALEMKLQEVSTTLNKARVLVDKLGAEYESWKAQMAEYKQKFDFLEAKSLLIALCINFLCNLTAEARKSKLDSITADLTIPSFNLIENFISEEEIVVWESMGLPRDTQSLQNAALLADILKLPFGLCCTPLVLDPLRIGILWLLEYLKSSSRQSEVASQNSETFSKTLELAARFGKVMIITDCERIRLPLLQIIPLDLYSKYNDKCLRIGNKIVAVHENFRIVLFTTMNSVEVGSETSSLLSIIPFKVTTTGFTRQLLLEAVKLKKPELEEKRTKLLKNESKLLKERAVLQDKLLEELSSATGNILNNEPLWTTLNEVKESTDQISSSLQDGAKLKDSLLKEYSQFEGMCNRAAYLYTGLTEIYGMASITFKNLFIKCLEVVQEDSEPKKYEYLVRSVYKNLCKSTPRNEHLALGLFICRKAFPEIISEKKWALFVTNFQFSEDSESAHPSWIRPELKSKILAIKSSDATMYEKLHLEDEALWMAYVTRTDNKTTVPVKVDVFEKILLSQIFRKDLLVETMHQTVNEMIKISAKSYVEPTIKQLFEDTSLLQPIILVTKSSIDISEALRENAMKVLGRDGMYTEIVAGSTSIKHCLKQLQLAAETGQWFCLKNAHFATEWLQELDKDFEALGKPLNTFRLWLLCDSTDMFPNTLLHRSIKVILEAPLGLKNKLRYRMQQWASTANSIKEPKVIKLCVAELILDTILQERRNFIPQGWSKWYDFGDADLNTALHLTTQLFNDLKNSLIDWSILKVLFENLVYGGHINNERDLEVLRVYFMQIFNENTFKQDWRPPGWKIPVPTQRKFEDYYDVLNKLPDKDGPDCFGLAVSSSNYQRFDMAESTIGILKNAYVKSEQKYSIEKRVKPILSLWKKLMQNVTVVQTYKTMTCSTHQSSDPWTNFTTSEMVLGGTLLKRIHESLVLIHSTMKEPKETSKQNNILINAIADNLVPSTWRKIWRGPKNLAEYMKAAVFRGLEAERRYRNSNGVGFETEIDLATIFSADAFLTFLKIATSSKTKESISNLILYGSTERPQTGGLVVKISPLTVDGAYIENAVLTCHPSRTDTPKQITPMFHLSYIAKENADQMRHSTVKLPVYTNSARETYLCDFIVKTNEDYNAAVLSGAALIVPSFRNK